MYAPVNSPEIPTFAKSQPPKIGPTIFPVVLLMVSRDSAGTNLPSPTISNMAVLLDGSSIALVAPCMNMAAKTIHSLSDSIWKATMNSMAPEVRALTT